MFTSVHSVGGFVEQGQSQLVTCSGVFKDGSLRCIRNGIGISMTVSCHGSYKPSAESSRPYRQTEWTLSQMHR